MAETRAGRSNAAVLGACVLVGVRAVGWAVDWLRHPTYSTRWLPTGLSRYALGAAAALAVAWTLFRNLA